MVFRPRAVQMTRDLPSYALAHNGDKCAEMLSPIAIMARKIVICLSDMLNLTILPVCVIAIPIALYGIIEGMTR